MYGFFLCARQREIREPFLIFRAAFRMLLQWKIVDNNISLDGS